MDWREKMRALIRDAADRCGVERPRIVVPKRFSGPTMMPSDWYERDQQEKVAAQCNCCHCRPLPGETPLVKGLCGPCRVRLADTPEAA